MRLNLVKVLGVNLTIAKKELILEEIRKYLLSGRRSVSKPSKKLRKPLIIFTPNPEIINYAQNTQEFKRVVNTAQINLPDGRGTVWAVKQLTGRDIRPIPGVEMMDKLCRMAGENGFRIGLIGGRNGLALKTAECLGRLVPKIKIEVIGEPEIDLFNIKNEIKYFEKLSSDIRNKKIEIIFVALGHPKQEFFISQFADKLNRLPAGRRLVMMAVGGSFDFISGRVKRAPDRLRQLGLEWLFRLLKEPWRFKRQIKGSMFFLRVLLRT